ncbi:MAG TPA: hypothetical protein EYG40_09005 [Verrucomicrobia bacterium]|nr:hypothetical protein [Verrucomicrobiales bacterium]HIL55161.1 hypothetical protein [Verrucomicrobiota bacterium]
MSKRNELMGLRIFLLLFFAIGIAISSEDDNGPWRLEMTIEQEPSPELIELRKEISDKEKQNQSSPDSSKTMKEKILSFLKEFTEKIAPLVKNNSESKGKSVEEDSIDSSVSVELSMSGKVHSIDKEYLIFGPALSPEKKIKVPIKKITSLSRQSAKIKDDQENSESDDFRVMLRDGSEILGDPVQFTGESFIIALSGTQTRIPLPINEIIRIERDQPVGNVDKLLLPDSPRRHIAALATGEILAGQLLPSVDSEKWLRISSPILSAEVPLSVLDVLLFPDPDSVIADVELELADEIKVVEDGNNGAPDRGNNEPQKEEDIEVEESPVIRNLVTLSPSGMIWADKLELRGSDLILSALGMDELLVPMSRVESLSFGHEGLPASAPVLVWGGYTDEDDEYVKTIDALSGRIPSRKIVQSKSKVPDPQFMRNLRRSRVLLIPEMEGFKRALMKVAMEQKGKGCPTWSLALRGFLKRGGNIIFLSPTSEGLSFINECGLGPIRSGPAGRGWEITDEGRKLGINIEGMIKNVNASHYYRKSAPWEVWGAAQGGADGAILLGRRIDRGWVMVFGSDFYQSNDTIKEILFHLIQFNGRG